MASTALQRQLSGKKTRKVVKRRRTKGPSEKIRSLAALSLSAKVAYLKIGDLIGADEARAAALINERLPRRNYKKGETVYPSNQKGPVLFVVKSGSINIGRRSVTGSEFDVKSVEPGSVFGEMPVMGQSMHGARAVAAEASKVVIINSNDLEKIAAASPSFALNVIKHIGPRLVNVERRHEQAAFQPVTSRIASLLLRLANRENQVVGFTHQEMADELGVYRETVTNAIAELKADGLIKVGRKRITILNRDALLKMEAL